MLHISHSASQMHNILSMTAGSAFYNLMLGSVMWVVIFISLIGDVY